VLELKKGGRVVFIGFLTLPPKLAVSVPVLGTAEVAES